MEPSHLAVHLLAQLFASHAGQRVGEVSALSCHTLRAVLSAHVLRRVRCRLIDLKSLPDVLFLLDPRLLLGLLLFFLPHYGEVRLVVIFTEDGCALSQVEVLIVCHEVEVS